MREIILQFAKICADNLPTDEPIYEFGSLRVPGQENIASISRFYPGKKYIGADMRQGLGVDVILNLHQIGLPPETSGTVLVYDTLEHVEYPRKALEEIHRILKPDGIVIISSVMKFPIHDYPNDYWRFTPEGFRSLLNIFNYSFVESAGEEKEPHTVVAIGFKGYVSDELKNRLPALFAEWKSQWSYPMFFGPHEIGWKSLARIAMQKIPVTFRRILNK
jgi:SAM-dependent methyltransferase